MSRNIVLRRSPIHGNGVFAARDLPKGKRLIQYRGALRSHDEVDQCYGGDADSGHTFLFTLNEHYVIDGNVNGNVARWINYSCEPNCEAVLYESDDGDPAEDRVFIEAIRDIRAGEELTYDYGIVLEERHTPRMKKIWACRCGSDKCTGTMLKSKR
ncbi:SET domain-containing protein [Sinimarinibacterium sp. CAU 1509]|uniref:SET domain-containing protein n=1 Tax=Sinimarinibacterium sp. CAU 1509 TaxID=2562283 RepID=UPI0010AD50EB|nr:SET domain-containing protein [Sinimarinibacterium sp. CAU 1509]TJY64960.1 SET domain-containing protein [Sinimarinibacterium sp. CAU 1509]